MNGGQRSDPGGSTAADGGIRFLDIVLSLTALAIAWPVILGCAVLIAATSKGAPLFAQTRVGRNERPFICYKLRTMRKDAPNVASHEMAASAVTPVGMVLRRVKLDELPQMINVLRGDMSFVGPRPSLPTQLQLVEARRRLGLFYVRPGITGPAQIQGIDMSDPERLAAVDVVWLKRRTIRGYFVTIFLTALGRGQGDRVRVKGVLEQ